MKRALNSRPLEDFQLLVPSEVTKKPRTVVFSPRLKWYLFVLFASVVGFLACLLVMFNTTESQSIAHSIGLTRVGNGLNTILDLLAYPVLMLTAISAIYAIQRLYGIYKTL
jgi:hypothetical protein